MSIVFIGGILVLAGFSLILMGLADVLDLRNEVVDHGGTTATVVGLGVLGLGLYLATIA